MRGPGRAGEAAGDGGYGGADQVAGHALDRGVAVGAADGLGLAVPAALAGRKPHPEYVPGRMPGESGGF
jgi:hypothetical protein